MIKCTRKCKCEECENLAINWPIVFIKQYGLNEKRETLVGVKCTAYGQCAETTSKLKSSGYDDDMIWL